MIILQITQEELRAMLSDVVRDALSTPAQAEGVTLDQSHSTPADNSHIKGIKGLAIFLKVSHSRAQALKNSGIFPHFQTGRLILFDPVKVREAMEKHSKRERRAK